MVATIVNTKVLGPDGKPIEYTGKFTFYVLLTTIVASCGGLLFGYDVGVTGGVSSMPAFLEHFFPDIARNQANFSGKNPYCTFNSALLQFFTSIAFIGGLLSAPVAAICTKDRGRKLTLLIGGGLYLLGALLMCTANHVAQVFLGRLMLGFGTGFANQATPMYLAEVAPAQYRGALTICFQQTTTIGIFVSQLINYGTQHKTFGWRISLGLQGFPAIPLILGGFILPETPNSLIERGMDDKGHKVLQKLRGVKDVDTEYNDIKTAALISKAQKNSWGKLFSRSQAPQAVTCCLMPFFQQFTGVNIIMFYAPQIFASIGQSTSAALLQTVIIGAINVGCTVVSIVLVDRFGRKILLLEGGYQMMSSITIFAALLGSSYNKSDQIPKKIASTLLAMACIFQAGFAWSWGPIAWLIPSEILTLETRAAGNGLNTSINFLATFIVGQSFLSMFCAMKYGVFLFFAGWILIMLIFVHFFVIESQNVPIEEVHEKYHNHWFWKRLVGDMSAVEEEKQAAKKNQFVSDPDIQEQPKV